MSIFEPNALSFESESSLIFSIPTHVGQGDILHKLWLSDGDVESTVFRKTHFGAFVWRMGSKVILSSRDRDRQSTRLDIVRALTASRPTNENESVSQLKSPLISDRTYRYDSAMSLRYNLQYPLVIYDRLSLEIDPVPTALEKALLRCEHDVSDNNLGLTFEHRVSMYVCPLSLSSVKASPFPRERRRSSARSETTTTNDAFGDKCADSRSLENRNHSPLLPLLPLSSSSSSSQPTVRVSLRATLNEFHEIGYTFELECEDTLIDDETVQQRCAARRRHDAIGRVFTAICAPWLNEVWPVGLSRERLPTAPYGDILDARRRLAPMTSGRSWLTHERLYRHLISRTTMSPCRTAPTTSRTSRREFDDADDEEMSVVKSDETTWVKMKFDGVRAYGWYSMGTFWVDGTALSDIDAKTRRVLGGTFLYQVESLDVERRQRRCDDNSCDEAVAVAPRHHVITEVAFVIDHSILVATGHGGALVRQFEISDGRRSYEQSDPRTAYVLLTDDIDVRTRDFWPDIATELARTTSTGVTLLERTVLDFIGDAIDREETYVTVGASNAVLGAECRRPGVAANGRSSDRTVPRSAFARLKLSRLTRDLAGICDRDSAEISIALIASSPPFSDSFVATLERIDRFRRSVSMSRANRKRDSSSDNALNRALIPLSQECSDRMMIDIGAMIDFRPRTEVRQLSIAPIYPVPDRFVDLLRDYRDCCSSASPLRIDGLLLERAVTDRFRYYEKLKLRQTVELLLTSDRAELRCREGTFANLARSYDLRVSNVRHIVSEWRTTITDDCGFDVFRVIDMPLSEQSGGSNDDEDSMVEVEYGSPWSIDSNDDDDSSDSSIVSDDSSVNDENRRHRICDFTFVRRRDDKFVPDSVEKIMAIAMNR